MSKVIKNNDGVAVVEGTPAASLVKDVDKFFTAKPPKRMAGEAIKPQKLGAEKLTEPAMETNLEEKKKTPQEKEMKREEAVDKTKEFKRQRSAEKSEDEQEATQGKFITTLGR